MATTTQRAANLINPNTEKETATMTKKALVLSFLAHNPEASPAQITLACREVGVQIAEGYTSQIMFEEKTNARHRANMAKSLASKTPTTGTPLAAAFPHEGQQPKRQPETAVRQLTGSKNPTQPRTGVPAVDQAITVIRNVRTLADTVGGMPALSQLVDAMVTATTPA